MKASDDEGNLLPGEGTNPDGIYEIPTSTEGGQGGSEGFQGYSAEIRRLEQQVEAGYAAYGKASQNDFANQQNVRALHKQYLKAQKKSDKAWNNAESERQMARAEERQWAADDAQYEWEQAKYLADQDMYDAIMQKEQDLQMMKDDFEMMRADDSSLGSGGNGEIFKGGGTTSNTTTTTDTTLTGGRTRAADRARVARVSEPKTGESPGAAGSAGTSKGEAPRLLAQESNIPGQRPPTSAEGGQGGSEETRGGRAGSAKPLPYGGSRIMDRDPRTGQYSFPTDYYGGAHGGLRSSINIPGTLSRANMLRHKMLTDTARKAENQIFQIQESLNTERYPPEGGWDRRHTVQPRGIPGGGMSGLAYRVVEEAHRRGDNPAAAAKLFVDKYRQLVRSNTTQLMNLESGNDFTRQDVDRFHNTQDYLYGDPRLTKTKTFAGSIIQAIGLSRHENKPIMEGISATVPPVPVLPSTDNGTYGPGKPHPFFNPTD